ASAGTTYSTSPDFTATRHVPHPPARQPASIRMPLASAKSNSDAASGFHCSVLLDLPKVTRSLFSMLVSLAVGAGVFSLTVAGPKASKWTLFFGTPHAARPSVTPVIIGPGPQRK